MPNKKILEPLITVKKLVAIDTEQPLNRAKILFKNGMEFEDSSEFALTMVDLSETFEGIFDSSEVKIKYDFPENTNIDLVENIKNLQEGN